MPEKYILFIVRSYICIHTVIFRHKTKSVLITSSGKPTDKVVPPVNMKNNVARGAVIIISKTASLAEGSGITAKKKRSNRYVYIIFVFLPSLPSPYHYESSPEQASIKREEKTKQDYCYYGYCTTRKRGREGQNIEFVCYVRQQQITFLPTTCVPTCTPTREYIFRIGLAQHSLQLQYFTHGIIAQAALLYRRTDDALHGNRRFYFSLD